MSDEEIKDICDKLGNEKTNHSKNDMWLPLFLSLLAFSGGSQTPNIALEKEVAYLGGKVDTLEKIIMERK